MDRFDRTKTNIVIFFKFDLELPMTFTVKVMLLNLIEVI